MRLYQLPFYGLVYRAIMRIAHRFHWHYAPPIYPDGDTHLWCKWCGFQQTIKKADYRAEISAEAAQQCASVDRTAKNG